MRVYERLYIQHLQKGKEKGEPINCMDRNHKRPTAIRVAFSGYYLSRRQAKSTCERRA